jgi:4-amino-4-deoxy-L-arabinose transferase-like glycosyltransferase
MTTAERTLCWVYGLIALAALVGTQWALVAFLNSDEGLGDLVAGPAATFATIDLLAVAVAATVFMVVDGRRTGLPRLWVYVGLVFVVAVSVAFPLFLIGRIRHLARQRTRSPQALPAR